MWIMGFTVAGMSAVDWMSTNMLPITMRKFTDNVFLIGLLIGSFNRMFGFVVQPFVAWKSDQIGRRRIFYLIGNPIALVSLMILGVMPLLFHTKDMRAGIAALICMWVFNILLQAFMDFSTGALDPLFADSFRQQKLGRAAGIRNYCGITMNLTMMFIALPLYSYLKQKWGEDNYSHLIPYLFAGFWVIAGWLIMKFLVKEKPVAVSNVKSPAYNPLAHFGMLKNPDYLKLAIIAALGLSLPAASTLFQSLFITQTLGLSPKQMGLAGGWVPVISFFLSFPLGYLADRFGPRYLLAAGFFGIAATNAAMSFYVHNFNSLLIISLAGGGIGIFSQVPMTAMIFQYASKKERGTVFGLIQFIRAFSAFSISLVVSIAVQQSHSSDTTKIYGLDIKDPAVISARLQQPTSEFDKQISQGIPASILEKIRTAKKEDEQKEAVAEGLNAVMDGRSIYLPAWSKDAIISKHTLSLATRDSLDARYTKLLNRSIMEDVFKEELSRKVNFRMAYTLNILVAILAGLLALTTKPGRYARTLKKSDLAEA